MIFIREGKFGLKVQTRQREGARLRALLLERCQALAEITVTVPSSPTMEARELIIGAAHFTAAPWQWAIAFSSAVWFAFYVLYSKRGLDRYRPETVTPE